MSNDRIVKNIIEQIKQVKGIQLNRPPLLIFNNRWHRFSKWGLSYNGCYSYRLNPDTCRGWLFASGKKFYIHIPSALKNKAKGGKP